MKTVLVILSLILSGCSVSILPHEIVKAQNFCKDHGGIQEISRIQVLGFDGARLWVRCIDGSFAGTENE